jgi:hypothetical protein
MKAGAVIAPKPLRVKGGANAERQIITVLLNATVSTAATTSLTTKQPCVVSSMAIYLESHLSLKCGITTPE